MKFSSILLLSFFLSNHSFSQSLEGEWRGSFVGEFMGEKPTAFALHFKLNKDSTYKVYSYSLLYNPTLEVSETVVSEVLCKIISADSIYLEEIKQVKPKGSPGCMQKFFLTLRQKKDKSLLEGRWELVNAGDKCRTEIGTVTLTKK
jgi:hypothetical protein